MMRFEGEKKIHYAIRYTVRTVLICCFVFFYATPVFSQRISSISENTSPEQKKSETTNAVSRMTDIHDIKPLEKPGFDPVFLYYILPGLIILSAFCLALYYWRRRKQKSLLMNTNVLTPEEAAFSALDEIAMYNKAQGREFYFKLSAILRTYIQGRYGINAPEMTTEEFLPKVDELKLARSIKKDLKDFVYSSDPIKFAATPAAEAVMKTDLNFVKTFVKETTPVLNPETNERKTKTSNTEKSEILISKFETNSNIK